MRTDVTAGEAQAGPDVERLQDYLSAELPGGLAGPLTCALVAGGRSNPTYELRDGQSEWILRRPPYGTVWGSAHDVGREARVMKALSGSNVPVPRVVAWCRDDSVLGAPFYVMDRLVGKTYRNQQDTAALSVAERLSLSESLLDTLVSLHEMDPASVGLEDFGRPDGYLERQLSRWIRQWQIVQTSAAPEVSEVHRLLSKRLPLSRLTGIVHGDYKMDNLIVAPGPVAIAGVLDWEMATLGDTLADVGYLVSCWDEIDGVHNPITAGATAHEGFPTGAEMIEGYASRRGIGIDDLEWYVAFSHFKLAVILQQIHHRHLRGETTGDWFDDIGPMVDPLLDQALARARRL